MQVNPALKLRRKFGSDAEVAKRFRKATRQAVNLWMLNGIPPERALEVEEVSEGDISAIDVLRFYRERKDAVCGHGGAAAPRAPSPG